MCANKKGHNPFSIQVYYYNTINTIKYFNANSRHNPFSIQVYYYDERWACHMGIFLLSQSLFNSGLLLRLAILSLPNGERHTVTIPFQFRSIITLFKAIGSICHAVESSQSLFNSGLLLREARQGMERGGAGVTIPFQFRSIITLNSAILASFGAGCHNPFSIQVYYYVCVMIL